MAKLCEATAMQTWPSSAPRGVGDNVVEQPQKQVVAIVAYFFSHGVISVATRMASSRCRCGGNHRRGVRGRSGFFFLKYLMFHLMYLDVSLVRLKCCHGICDGVSFSRYIRICLMFQYIFINCSNNILLRDLIVFHHFQY